MENNVLVIGTHHGVYVTLQSLWEAKFKGEIIVVVPKSQLVKYGGFKEPIFTEYGKTLNEYMRKHKTDVYALDWDVANPMTEAVWFLKSCNKTGAWTVLAAGAVYNQPSQFEPSTWQIAYMDKYPYKGSHQLDMYEMVNKNPNKPMAEAFAVNMDNIGFVPASDIDMMTRCKRAKISLFGYMRTEPLIGTALSPQESLRFFRLTKKSFAYSFWMACISGNKDQLAENFLAYPYETYLRLAKKVKKFLPEATFQRIEENGKEAMFYSEIKDLGL